MTERALSILDDMSFSRRRFLMAVAGSIGGICSGLLSPTRAASTASLRTITLGRLLMGTIVESEANHSELSIARKAVEAGLERIVEVDRLMSVFRADSEISLVNRFAGTSPTPVGEETFAVLYEAQRIADLSAGDFDVTIQPLMQLWRSARQTGRPPSHREVGKALDLVSCGDLSLDPHHRLVGLRRSGMGIDLGGIAKGYAVDVATGALQQHGVTSGLINAGGDLRVVGRNREGTVWRIGLRHPLSPSRLLLSILMEDEAAATSGNYLNFFIVEGHRYGHLLHPRNGTSADTPLSVTVIAKSAMRADGLATAAMIRGTRALAFLQGIADVQGIVVRSRPRHPEGVLVQLTSGLWERVELLEQWAVFER